MKKTPRGLTYAAVTLAATAGISIVGPHRANAEPMQPALQNDGLSVTLLSPKARASFSGVKPVEISAFYQGTAANPITSVELYVDGARAAVKTLDTPEPRGVVSFLVDASALKPGAHKIVIRASAADAQIVSTRTSFTYLQTDAPVLDAQPDVSQPSGEAAAGAPTLSIVKPSLDGQVQGVVKLKINAVEADGKSPYVSLFIDKAFKTLKNYAPYEFEWDTTAYTNGYHTIEAFGYNDDQVVGYAKPMRIYVNNPGGRTERRTDLLDGVKNPAVKKPVVKPLTRRIAAAPKPAAPRKSAALPRRPQILASGPAVVSPRASAPLTMTKMADVAIPSADPALASPFAADAAPETARAVTPISGFKPLPEGDTRLAAATPVVHSDPELAAPKLCLADVRLPSDGLSSPFLAAPELAPHRVMASGQVALAQKRLRAVTAVSSVKTRTASFKSVRPAASLLRAKGQMSLVFNRVRLQMDRPIAEEDGIMFGPLRQIFEFGGGELNWDSKTQTVSAKSEDKKITLVVGQKNAVVNSKIVPMESAPYLNDGRTMVPLSFLPAALDVDVQYDAATGHLLVTSKK